MVHIKSYRIDGVGHSGAPYTMDMAFTPIQAGNRCFFDEQRGIPLDVAEFLVNQWNRTVKMYGNPTTYSVILPEQEMPVASQSTSTAKTNIEDCTMDEAFGYIQSGVWNENDFEEWVLSVTAEAHNDGYNDGIGEAKAMIDSLLKE